MGASILVEQYTWSVSYWIPRSQPAKKQKTIFYIQATITKNTNYTSPKFYWFIIPLKKIHRPKFNKAILKSSRMPFHREHELQNQET